MPQTVITLGPIVFQDFEVPTSITFGGRQRTAVRYLANGERVIDILGPNDATISFSGILSGSGASDRARELDTLRTLATPLDLSWESFNYSVIIENFQADFRNAWWIPYRLECAVLSNPNVAAATTTLSLAGELLDSLNLMYSVAQPAALPFADLRRTLPPISQVSGPTATADISAAIAGALTSVQEQRVSNEALIGLAPVDSPATPWQFLGTFDVMANASQALQLLAVAQDCLGQANVYLSGSR
jgi:hypothetical protein